MTTSTLILLPVYTSNVLAIILIITLFIGNSWRLRDPGYENRSLIALLILTLSAAIIDPLVYTIDGLPGTLTRVLVYAGNSWLYIANMLIAFVWLVFLSYHLNGRLYKKNAIIMACLSLIGIILIFVNLFKPLIFTLNESNVYSRCSLYWLYVTIAFIYLANSVVIYFNAKKRSGTLKRFPIFSFIAPIILGVIIQSLIYGLSLIWSTVAIAIAGIFVSLQNETIFHDNLTGLPNRFYFDVMQSDTGLGKSRQLTGIMLDLNRFKSINDEFGHTEGDAALIITANLLKKSVGDLGVAIRFAGDEFIAFINTQDDDTINKLVADIQSQFRKFNASGTKPYVLSASIGIHKIDLDKQSINELLNEIDKKMYEDKSNFYASNPELDRRLAIDNLTGLYSKSAFYHHAKVMIESNPGAQFSLVLSDIDNFKSINQKYGEETGDALLKYTGQQLKEIASDDVLFAHYSADQFVGLFKLKPDQPAVSEEEFMRSVNAFQANAPVDGFEVKFGIYENVDTDIPISTMCDRALTAARSIKHQYGRNIALYDRAMHQKSAMHQTLLDSMQEGLSFNQFKIRYQPKHDALTGNLVGAEALISWHHPEFGNLSPAEFIPLFEQTGFISQVDWLVLKTVCDLQINWQSEGLPVVPISVNTSRKDLLNPNFISRINEVINKTGIDTSLIHAEITESVYMEDPEKLIPIVEKLKDLGVEIELDDFGSGFSSLGMLTKIPLDIIKLDMSMIKTIEKESRIVESAIHLAHNLGYGVVAEGVETESQLDILRKLKCDFIQGYYFSKPLPEDEFKEYLNLYSHNSLKYNKCRK